MTIKTAWPENVIARYLTVGGATVDLTDQLNVLTPPQSYATLAPAPAARHLPSTATTASCGG
ncbi:hypothetical protein DDE05_58825 [Streptomyces cavourensis]|nr:hypothetical protein DDE05_58825 [Streptomyces cavourensis]